MVVQGPEMPLDLRLRSQLPLLLPLLQIPQHLNVTRVASLTLSTLAQQRELLSLPLQQLVESRGLGEDGAFGLTRQRGTFWVVSLVFAEMFQSVDAPLELGHLI